MPRFGAHLSIAGGLPRAVERAVASRCEALQIFTKSAGQWRARPLPDAEVAEFRRLARVHGIAPLFAHASYLINLAAADATLRARSVVALEEELTRAERLGLSGLILHPGAYTAGSEDEGLTLIAEGVRTVLSGRRRGRTLILLEHTAGQGTSLGHRFEHLSTIIARAGGLRRLGVCLDTCHLLAAGYDIRTRGGYDATFTAFERLVGIERLRVFHLNDSKRECGSRVDRHEQIGRGCLGAEPFRWLVTDARFAHLPMLLETPKLDTPELRRQAGADPWDVRNLRLLRRLARTV
jgi:deoxyribonuclease-4